MTLRDRIERRWAPRVIVAASQVVEGELFWGQDRIDEVERAISTARDRRP